MIFSTIINKIKEVISKMFSKGTIESKINMDIAMSTEMQNHIDLCKKVHKNKAPWIDNKTIFSSNTGVGIAAEFARLVTIEFKSEISNNDFLNKEYQVVIDNIRNYTQFACAEGGLVFKPYVSNGRIFVDFVRADAFFPTSFNSRGDILGAVFLETKVTGDTTYTRLEIHNLETRKEDGKDVPYCVIRNLAFKKKNYNHNDNQLGDAIELTEVEEWAGLKKEVTIRNVDRPLFAYFKMPLANTIDSTSPLGVSVYSGIVEPNGLLEQVDKIYSNVLWEYESKQAAVFADLDMFKKSETGTGLRGQLEDGTNRLYKLLDIGSEDGTKKLSEYSPDIRDVSMFNGLNELLRKVEFQCGLAYGSISKEAETAKTATEIKTSKQRSYQTVKDIQKSLHNALESLVYAMSTLGILYKLPVKVVNIETDISYSFDDSIIVDKEMEMTKIFNYVSAGILKPEYLLEKDLGFNEEDIKKYMQDQSVLINPSPFDAATQE